MSASTLRPVDGPDAVRSPGAAAAALLLSCVVIGVGGFEALWFGVVTGTGLAAEDPVVDGWAVGHRGAGTVTAARVVSDLGAPGVTVTAAVIMLVWWAWRRAWATAAFGALGLAVLVAVDLAAKSLVARPRPPAGWHAVAAQGFSFPSGHAMLSAGVVLLIWWSARRHDLPARRRLRLALGGVAAVFVLAVGASRVVLAVHFPSDVLAGWSLAVLVVSAVALVALMSSHRAPA